MKDSCIKIHLALLIGLMPLASQAQLDLRLNYVLEKLPNGLTVILHEDHTTPTVAVDVWYHVGSSYEKPGRTGFAHLFEHIMFEGSGNVKEGDFDNLLEGVGGSNNGSTNTDRTNYYETLPSNALDVALFLESDRMGYLLKDMSPGKVDGQRDVVKNERRQSYENRPYGLAFENIVRELYPENHPYHWDVIGSMADLSAASYEDVTDFFKKYYVPNNAVLTIAGDIDPKATLERVKYWFNEIPAGAPVNRPVAPNFSLTEAKYLTLEDNVQLPRLYLVYKTPATLTPGDAEMDIIANVLAAGKTSRLYQRLVYELGIAQDVNAFQNSMALSSNFVITVTARPGHSLPEILKVVDAEIQKLEKEGPTKREIERVVNQNEARALREAQSIESKAESLNTYYYYTGNPDYLNEDLARYRAIEVKDIQAITARYLQSNQRLLLSIVPKTKTDLAVTKP
jgi:zinc protease